YAAASLRVSCRRRRLVYPRYMARALVVLGPTAAGKSEVALGLARRQGGEIINADALQAYRGLAIGTAQPDPAARAAVPHHLYGLLDPRQAFSAGEFARLAGAAVREVEERG